MKKEINDKILELPENPYTVYIEVQERARKKQIALKEQAKLDFQKWLDSEHKQADLSGCMPWCMFCKWRRSDVDCGCDPELRTANAMCVDAYHKMQEKISK